MNDQLGLPSELWTLMLHCSFVIYMKVQSNHSSRYPYIHMKTCLQHDLWAIPSQWMVMVSPFDNNAIKSTHLIQRPCGFLSQPFPFWAKLTRKQRLGVDAAPCKLNVLLSMCSHVLVFIILLAIKVFTFVVIRNYTLAANNCKSSSKVYTFETVNSGLFSEWLNWSATDFLSVITH